MEKFPVMARSHGQPDIQVRPGKSSECCAVRWGLPWQRVLGAGGAIKLQGDNAMEQRFRLEAEGVTFRGAAGVDMKRHEFHFAKTRVGKVRTSGKKKTRK